MAIAFPQTALALDLDRGLENRVLGGAGAAILLAWWCWASVASLPLTLETSQMRVEPVGGVLPLAWAEPANLVDLAVSNGMRVAKGQLIAVRDEGNLQRDRALAAARLQQLIGEAERLNDELGALVSADDRAAQADQAKAASAELAAAKSRLSLEQALSASERSHALAAKGLVSRSADEQAQSEADLARNANDSAVADLLRAKLDVQGSAAQRAVEVAARKRRQDEAKLAIEAARLTLEGADAALRAARLVAPASGTIAVPSGVAPGAFLPGGSTVATLSPDGAVEVRVRFDGTDAVSRLEAGQAAELTPERTGGFAPVRLRVVSVLPSSEGAGADATLVAVDPGAMLKAGLGGRVTVSTGTATPLGLLAAALGFESGRQ